MANYEILIKAILDKANLQTQITQVQNQMNTVGGGKGGITLINAASNNAEIEKVKQKVMSLRNDVASFNKVSIISNDAGAMTGAMAEYVDNAGMIKQMQLEIKAGTTDWAMSQEKVTDNIKQTTAEVKKLENEWAAAEKQHMADLQTSAKIEDDNFNRIQRNKLNYEQSWNDAHTENINRDQEVANRQNKQYDTIAKAQIAAAQDVRNEEAKTFEEGRKHNAENLNNSKLREKAINDYTNKLRVLQANSKTAFTNPQVKTDLMAFNAELDKVKSGAGNLDVLDNSFNNLNSSVKVVNKTGNDFLTLAENAVKKVLIWAGATTLLYGSLQQIEKAVQYVRDLDKEMTNIQLVTGQSSKEIGELATQYNKLATNLSVSTLTVAKGALEWQRAGYTSAEAMKLLGESTMLATLGNMDAEKSTKTLISTLKGFGLEVSDAGDVIDKLVMLDNKYAVSVASIGDALAESSSVAKQAGVTFDELASYVAVVAAATQQSGDTVGQAFKTIMTRFTNVKAGAEFDNMGESINNSEKVLNSFNISLRDSAKEFRPMGDVINDIAAKWEDLTTVERAQIATAAAGTRQQNYWMALMENFPEVIRAQGLELTATGLRLERYKIYQESVAASTNRMTAAWEKLVITTINSGLVKFFIDAGTASLGAIDSMGGLVPILTDILGIIILIKAQQIGMIFTSLTGAAFNLVTIFQGALFNTGALLPALVSLVNPITAIGLAIVAVVGAWNQWNEQITKTQNAGMGATENAWKTFFESAISNGMNASQVLDEYQKAVARVNEEHAKGGIIASLFVDKEKIIKQGLQATIDALGKSSTSWDEYQKNVSKAIEIAESKISKSGDIYREFNADITKDIKILTEAQLEQNKALAKTSTSGTPGGAIPIVKTLEELKKLLDEDMNGLSSLNDQMNTLIENYGKYGQLGLDQVAQLRTAFGEDYVKALYTENGQIKLNEEALKSLVIAKAMDAWATANKAYITAIDTGATKENIAALKEQAEILGIYYNQLKDGTTLSVKSAEAQKKSQDDILKMTIDMIKQRKEAEKDALQDQLKAFKDSIDARKDALQKQADSEKQHLQDQLDGYKAIIQAEKDLIDQRAREEDFQDKVGEKNKQISDIDAQLLAMQFDNSEEAKAKRLQLEDEKTKVLKELGKIQKDNTIENQKEALDKEINGYETGIKAKQTIIERNLVAQKAALDQEYKDFEANINAKIAKIDDYLKQSGTITSDAMALMNTKTDAFYQSLLDWNQKYGTSVQKNIIDLLNEAFGIQLMLNSMGGFGGGSYSGGNTGGGGTGPIGTPGYNYYSPPEYHHDGADSGFVGQLPKLKSNEQFAVLMKGEGVFKPNQMDNFMKNVLPNIAGTGRGDTNIELNLNVAGSLDKSVLPNLKEVVLSAVNSALSDRGTRRNAFSFSGG